MGRNVTSLKAALFHQGLSVYSQAACGKMASRPVAAGAGRLAELLEAVLEQHGVDRVGQHQELHDAELSGPKTAVLGG